MNRIKHNVWIWHFNGFNWIIWINKIKQTKHIIKRFVSIVHGFMNLTDLIVIINVKQILKNIKLQKKKIWITMFFLFVSLNFCSKFMTMIIWQNTIKIRISMMTDSKNMKKKLSYIVLVPTKKKKNNWHM